MDMVLLSLFCFVESFQHCHETHDALLLDTIGVTDVSQATRSLKKWLISVQLGDSARKLEPNILLQRVVAES